MTKTREAGRRAPRTGFQNVFVGTIDSLENSRFAAPVQPEPALLAPDPDLLRSVVERRLAAQLGVSRAVATVVAGLANLGPDAERRGRR